METVPNVHPSRESGVWTLSQEWLVDAVGRAQGRKALRRDGQASLQSPAAWGQLGPGLGLLCAVEREKGRFTRTLQRAEFCLSLQEHTELKL